MFLSGGLQGNQSGCHHVATPDSKDLINSSGLTRHWASERLLFAAVELEPVGTMAALAWGTIPKAPLAKRSLLWAAQDSCFLDQIPRMPRWIWHGANPATLTCPPRRSGDGLTLQRSGTVGLDRRISWEHNYINALQMLGKAAEIAMSVNPFALLQSGISGTLQSGLGCWAPENGHAGATLVMEV